MNAEQKTTWLAALRSGEYTQGQGRLVSLSEGGVMAHCCLGVLCDLADKAGVVQKKTIAEYSIWYDDDDGALPPSVVQWAGMTDAVPNPIVKYRGVNLSLAELNDGTRTLDGHNFIKLSFAEIADIIEEQL
jgi:hypothetical protein